MTTTEPDLDQAALDAAHEALYQAWSSGDYSETEGLAYSAVRAYLLKASAENSKSTEKRQWHEARARALREAADRLSPKPTHRHKKRGTEYVLIGYGKMQAESWIDTTRGDYAESVDMREVAIYRSVTDPTEIWVRPREEFEDGRFEVLP